MCVLMRFNEVFVEMILGCVSFKYEDNPIAKKYIMLIKIYIDMCVLNFVLSSDSEVDVLLDDPRSA